MNVHLHLRVVLTLVSVLWLSPQFITPAGAQPAASPDGIWQKLATLPDAPANARPGIRPNVFQPVTLDAARLRETLANAPREVADAPKDAGLEITLPMPDGTFARFRVQESSVMEPELAAKFPEIKTYSGRGIDDPLATLQLDINQRTFHAQILSPHGAVYIDPYWHLDGSVYMSYFKRDLPGDPNRFKCFLDGNKPSEDKLKAVAEPDNSNSGRLLRTYRLACATSIQYSQYHSADITNPTVPEVMAALVTMVNRVSGIYQTELAVRMVLVANNDQIVATTSNPGPFTDTPGDIQLNPAYCDTKIGAANYDIGHVVTVGSGGVAGLGVVCQGFDVQFGGSAKAAGTTGFNPPVGDPFWVDYVAHEMGHQFGGNHTFNGSGTNCGAANQNPNTAYEPGSGSTIQAYAGICGAANNLQRNSDPYFHFISLIEMFNYASVAEGSTCPVATQTGNNPPTVSARPPGLPASPTPAYVIPARTPFALTAFNGVDPDGDDITYCWEEADLGPEKPGNAPDNGSSALFRSFNPTPNPTRTFPRLQYVLNNANTPPASYPCGTSNCIPGEMLPTTTRKLDFRATVRDNRGGFGMDTIRLNVVDTGAGFEVTAPNTAATVQGGSTYTVTWNVAGTTANGINASHVDILLTMDATPATGEPSFPIVLAANTPNDGSEVVTMPNTTSSKARVKIAAAGNVFFDISNANFTINSEAPELSNVVSRKTHGTAGNFDIPLPMFGTSGVECRRGGANGDYTLVFTFANAVSGGTASVTGGTGMVSSGNVGADTHQYIVNLTGVANAQTLTVTIANITDTTGRTGSVSVPMRVLIGDTNGNGTVNATDVSQAKAVSGQNATEANFRRDVTANGTINSSDVSLIKAASGTSAP
jgi:hypothetical protein